ncbi:uncharacterized protein LOC128547756 [Mercenaria mercenaria]|uniref:uncharacterized protein LOC128547756 n=1 Tax=Mercenaria mercenaria TaxID=6596 RepID=UPI00234F22FB|nr:uncharacterized protein LOC128547756 [Mercenaria mercenaria]
MAAPSACTRLLQSADHTYSSWKETKDKCQARVPSIFGIDHGHSKGSVTPTKTTTKTSKKRARGLTTPTGKTPFQLAKKISTVENKPRQHIHRTSKEKDFLINYAAMNPRGTETVQEY